MQNLKIKYHGKTNCGTHHVVEAVEDMDQFSNNILGSIIDICGERHVITGIYTDYNPNEWLIKIGDRIQVDTKVL